MLGQELLRLLNMLSLVLPLELLEEIALELVLLELPYLLCLLLP